MKRIVFNLSVGVSAMLFVATGMLWIQSYREHDYLEWSDDPKWPSFTHRWEIEIARGGLAAWAEASQSFYASAHKKTGSNWHLSRLPRAPYPSFHDPRSTGPFHFDNATVNGFRHLGFEARHIVAQSTGVQYDQTGIVIPIPVIAILTAFAPMRMILRLRHRRSRMRIAKGLCGACGYDLRASSNRCPECGTLTTEAPDVHPGLRRGRAGS